MQAEHSSSETVSRDNTAISLGSGDIPVYSTPSMIALMENAAKSAAKEMLQSGEATVGAEICVKHLRPSVIGRKITATAVLTSAHERKLSFTLEASDEKGVIGNGTHIRYIVNEERFMQKASE